MQSDAAGNITVMEQDEILAYQFYARQRDSPKGLKFDKLPYSSNFGWIRTKFNHASGEERSHRHIWLLLECVIRSATEAKIDTFLVQRA
jgi:hypothetical protein